MGAGTCEEHYMQDAAECYWVFICQRLLVNIGLNINSFEEKESEFNNYCSERKITECFMKSDYKLNMDKCVYKFISEIVKKFPDTKMDIRNVEVEFRNSGKKGDNVIQLDTGEEISFSLKNYRCGYDNIQLKSGTWHSFINNCVLNEADGPGMYLDSRTNKRFRAQGKSLKKRNQNYIDLGHSELLKDLSEIDIILEEIKQKYVYSEESNFFTEEIAKKWQDDCHSYGNKGIEIVIKALNKIQKEILKKKFLKDTDLCHSEELLLIGKNGEMMCSLFNEKYKELLIRVNSETCELSYLKHEKNLRIIFTDESGEILKIDVPFTLQKNGAWFIPKNKYEGEYYHKKEKCMLKYGQRRPQKSKEISTSTNMWFNIKEHL